MESGVGSRGRVGEGGGSGGSSSHTSQRRPPWHAEAGVLDKPWLVSTT